MAFYIPDKNIRSHKCHSYRYIQNSKNVHQRNDLIFKNANESMLVCCKRNNHSYSKANFAITTNRRRLLKIYLQFDLHQSLFFHLNIFLFCMSYILLFLLDTILILHFQARYLFTCEKKSNNNNVLPSYRVNNNDTTQEHNFYYSGIGSVL